MMRKHFTLLLTLLMILTMGSVIPAGNAYARQKISKAKAVKIALKDAGLKKSKVKSLHTESEDEKYEVEFTKKSNKAEYEYEISKTGRILEKSVDYVYKHNSSTSKIGKKAARKKVASHSGIKLSIIKKGSCSYEYDSDDDDDDDEEGVYKIKFKKGHYKYEYEVLAPTGKIIEWSKEYIK